MILEERVQAEKRYTKPLYPVQKFERKIFIEKLRKALYASKIISYAQGFMLMREAAKSFNWKLNYGGIALMWRGGCIIRSVFLGNIKDAYNRDPDLYSLLFDDQYFQRAILDCQQDWRDIVSQAVLLGIPVPTLSSALAFYDGYRCGTLPANLIQVYQYFYILPNTLFLY